MKNLNQSLIALGILAVFAFVAFIKTPPVNDIVRASYQASISAGSVTPDSTHEFVTDLQISAWNALLNPAVVSSTYQSLVSQSGTAAPTGSTLHTDFGATTFAWARTATGTYTLTASAPTFTAGKTALLMSNPNAFLNNFKYTVTSSTVITLQTATLSVISLLLTPGNADSLFSNTMVYVIVYP